MESDRVQPVEDITSREKVARTLAKLLKEATDADREDFPIDTSAFFDRWFKEFGRSLLFVFRKNLRVTNIQYGELVALLRTFSSLTDKEGELQFASPAEFSLGLRRLAESFPISTEEEIPRRAHRIATRYLPILENLVVIDPYFGSCAVFLSPAVEVKLASICAYSGYIHSCGENVYVRRIDKATKVGLFSALRSYLDRHGHYQTPLRFHVYTHEDFTRKDAKEKILGRMQNGLHDLKIYVEKFYMGDDRLQGIVDSLDDEFPGEIEVPEHDKWRKNYGADTEGSSTTLWLYRDRGIVPETLRRAPSSYYICFHQLYKNGNPFHLFDEGKPAWVAPTTIPHTLLGAMLNLTRPDWPVSGEVSIADPFVGTGTTVLEILKHPRARAYCSDFSDASPILVEDNVRIFSASRSDIEEIMSNLKQSVEALEGPLRFLGGELKKEECAAAVTQVGGLIIFLEGDEKREIRIVFNNDTVARLSRMRFEERLPYYLFFRAIEKNVVALLRDAGGYEEKYSRELVKVLRDLKFRGSLLEEEEITDPPTVSLGASAGDPAPGFDIVSGPYSMTTTFLPKRIASRWEESGEVYGGLDVKEFGGEIYKSLMGRNEFDVIIADPPYGFNTDEDIESLAEIYDKMIPRLVGALRKGGHLVLCLPEHSFIGRRSPFFTHKEMVVMSVSREAKRCGLEILQRAVPEPSNLFRAPFYWRSQKALIRSIVHFALWPRVEGYPKEVGAEK